jgi:hypothetical protein
MVEGATLKIRWMLELEASFLRRFVQHILPRGFVRIRQSGFLANTCRAARVALVRTLLASSSTAATATHAPATSPTETAVRASWTCPRCGSAMIRGPTLSALHARVALQFVLRFESRDLGGVPTWRGLGRILRKEIRETSESPWLGRAAIGRSATQALRETDRGLLR